MIGPLEVQMSKSRIFIVLLFLLILNGCTSTRFTHPTRFTQENIMKLRPGMSAEEVIAIFGNPIKTEAKICGGATNRPWSCITWWYDSTDILDAKRLKFQNENERVYLYGWDMP